jgi:tetratricopeptide (TPR) repeat protein
MVPAEWPYLSVLLPDLLGSPPVGNERETEQLVLRAFTAFVQTIADMAPVAILLDDLHWADASSLNLLLHLARHTRSSRILLLGTYRDLDVGRHHPLEDAIRDLTREDLMERVTVRRLERDDTCRLIAATLGIGLPPPAFVELIHDRTDGNPFFVQQVVRELAEHGKVPASSDVWDDHRLKTIEVPESIRSAVGRRLSRLSPDAQEILRVGSVLGRTMSFDELVALSGRSEDVVDARIVEAKRAGLVQEIGPDLYSYNHSLTQQTLYEELSPRRKRKLHLTAGEVIERLPERKREARTAELARHFLDGGDTERAFTYAVQAGTAAEVVAGHSEAEWYYRTAVDLAEEMDNALHTAEALEKHGHVLSLLGRVDDAITSLERAARVYHEQGMRDNEAYIIAALCEVSFAAGQTEAIIERAREARASIEEQGGPLVTLGRLYLAEGYYLWSQEDVEGMRSLLPRLLEVAHEAGDMELLLETLIAASTGLRLVGDVDEALQMLAEGAALAEAAGNLYWQTIAHMAQGETHVMLGQLPAAVPIFRRMHELAGRLHNPIWLAYAKAQLSWALRLSGEWEAAEREVESVTQLAAQAGPSWGSFRAPLAAGELYLLQGRSTEAEQVLHRAWKIAENGHDTQWQSLALSALADLEILRGDPGAALAWLDMMSEVTADASSRGWALLGRDQPDEAEAIGRRILDAYFRMRARDA